MKVVTPYRPFIPDNPSHKRLGPFDWGHAIRMLRTSVARTCHCETVVLTGPDDDVPGPAYRYAIDEPRLMLWLLAVVLAYLRSDDFDDDTILISPDSLVFANLATWFHCDLGLMVRPELKYIHKPLLNGVQVWRLAARDRLVPFYERALAIAQTLPREQLRWGADTTPLVSLLAPLRVGRWEAAGLEVYGFPAAYHFRAVSVLAVDRLVEGQTIPPPEAAIVDFKAQRKRIMAQYYTAQGLPPC